jgi:hypothetical protein
VIASRPAGQGPPWRAAGAKVGASVLRLPAGRGVRLAALMTTVAASAGSGRGVSLG